MAKNRIPTLVIGLGGIGCRIAAGINSFLSYEDRKTVGIIGIDTNVNDLSQMEEKGLKTIRISENMKVSDYLTKYHPEYSEWFPADNKYLNDRGMVDGAGQIRALSRMAGLAASETKFYAIDNEITRIMGISDNDEGGTLAVVMVGSITGGTGAGLFLQMPYYIRTRLKRKMNLESIIIKGFFVGSELTEKVNPSNLNKEAVRANAYACIKELNAFYLLNSRSDAENNLELDFFEKMSEDEKKLHRDRIIKENVDRLAPEDRDDEYILESIYADADAIVNSHSNIPYDYLYLIEETNTMRTTSDATLGAVIDVVSRVVFTLLFTKVGPDSRSVEDNFVLARMKTNNMGRYAGTGMCRLIYPVNEVIDYVTNRSVKDLVSREWLYLDNKYNSLVLEAKANMKTGGAQTIPEYGKSYVKLFNDEMKQDGILKSLNNDINVYVNEKGSLNVIKKFIKFIEKTITGKSKNEELEQQRENECKLSSISFADYLTANAQLDKVEGRIRAYADSAKKNISDTADIIVNSIFPSSWDSLSLHTNSASDENIYTLLSGVHPISARYIIYSLIEELNKKLKKSEEGRITADADIKGGEVFGQKDSAENPKIKLVAINKKLFKRKSLETLYGQASGMVDAFVGSVDAYRLNSISCIVYKKLLTRLNMLADVYRLFFLEIEDLVEEKNKDIENTELYCSNNQFGNRHVYCTKECLRHAYNDYELKSPDPMLETTKERLFVDLFKIFAKDFEFSFYDNTENQKRNYESERSRRLRRVFETAVVDTIRTDVKKNSKGSIDIDIMAALRKQLLVTDNTVDENDENFKEKLTKYLKEEIGRAIKDADPMFTCAENPLSAESVYCTINPDCAAVVEGKPDVNETEKLYLPEKKSDQSYAFLMDDEFSKYEIGCVRSKYNYSSEHLVKYYDNSDNERAYRDRILSINSDPLDYSEESINSTVTPHINRYWHEEGFIPALMPDNRILARQNKAKAFIFGIGLDKFDIDTGKKIWVYYPLFSRGIPVRKAGRKISPEYHSLFDAMAYNGDIRRRLFEEKKAAFKRYKTGSDIGTLSADILKNEFIADLAGKDKDGNPINTMPDENIYDTFYKMFNYISDQDKNDLFEALLSIIEELCKQLFDNSRDLCNDKKNEILNYIWKESNIGQTIDKNAGKLSSNDRLFKSLHESIVDKKIF